jgi:pilus assembly protein CpaE
MFALNQADTILLVTQLDLPCLRNVVRLLMAFKDTPAIDQKVKVVVNRVGYETGQISLKKSQETMGREIYWQIPNDYRVMIEVRNNGVPLIQQAPKAAITQSICQLADSLSGKQDDSQDASSKVRSWLSLWPARA